MPVDFELTDGNASELVPRIAQTLVEGGLVRLRLAEGSWALALATDATAGERFLGLDETSPAALMLGDPDAANDLVLRPSKVLDRLMHGGFGPLLVAIHEQVIDKSLLDALPEATRQLVQRGEWVKLAPPAGRVTRTILQLVPGPLLVCCSHDPKAAPVYDMLVTDAAGSQPSPSVIRVEKKHWELVTSGAITVTDVHRIMAQRIVFVCTGNTCRSPIAEAMFRVLLAEQLRCAPAELLQNGYDVSSAGLAAMQGAPASPESVQLCAEQGVDLTAHASQPLTETVLEQADRLYTMTAGHREAILTRYPDLTDRVQVLSRNGQDVSDPIGCGRQAYEQSFTEITDNLRVLVDELTRSTRSDHHDDAQS